jgi:hypothetical protein
MLRMRSLVRAAVIACALLAGSAQARAQFALYTFEGPEFTVGQITPLSNQAPNSGSATFRTDFSSAYDPEAFIIEPSFFTLPMAGNVLVANNGVYSLNMLFNQPVYGLTVDFGLNADPGDLCALILSDGNGGFGFELGGDTGGFYAQGTLTYSSATPFTTVGLFAAVAPFFPTEFAIDNLRLDLTPTAAVPEPASLGLMLFGGIGVVVTAVRKKKRA